MLIYWHSPTLLVVVSLVAAIHSQQAPADARQNELLLQPSGQQQQQQPAANQQQANVAQMPLAISNKVAASPGAGLPWPRMAKRSWNKMQGVWGKRRAPEDEADASSAEYDDADADETEANDQAKRAWSSLTQQGWGKRSWNQMYGAWGKRGGGGNNWNKMQGVWGKRSIDQDQEHDDADADDATDEYLMAAKRSNWNKMQGVWGKRSLADDAFDAQDDDPAVMNEKRAWNQLHGAWGKRSPIAARYPDEQRNNNDDDPDSWTAAEKRGLSPLAAGYKRNWSNLRGSWGKREMPLAIIAGKGNEWSRKRESGWNNLKGLWG